MWESLSEQKSHELHESYHKLKEYLENEEYDKDCIKMDISKAFDGNINVVSFGEFIPQHIQNSLNLNHVCIMLYCLFYLK